MRHYLPFVEAVLKTQRKNLDVTNKYINLLAEKTQTKTNNQILKIFQ